MEGSEVSWYVWLFVCTSASIGPAEFVCLLYVPYFLQTSLPVAAPRLDRDFYVDLEQYRVLYYIYK